MNGEDRVQLYQPLPQMDWEAISDYYWGDRKTVGQIAEEKPPEATKDE